VANTLHINLGKRIHAELVAIAAVIIYSYSHIATDSLTSSMHQTKKQLSHPNLHRCHIQGGVLQSIVKKNSIVTITHLFPQN
jgi:hypothetical protein